MPFSRPAHRWRTRRAVLFAVLLAGHTAVTIRALMEDSYLELFAFAFRSWQAGQIFSDLTVSLVLVTSWMLWDAKRADRKAWPYVLATLAVGSFAPLTYLLVGELRGRAAA